MKELNIDIVRIPNIKTYKVFDDYLEAHEYICGRKDFTFKYNHSEYWRSVIINDTLYYEKRYHDTILLTVEAYNQMLNEAKKVFSIIEHDLIRTQKNSNCYYTGDLDSEEDVIKYMRNKNKSWLPQVYKEIDEEISVLQQKINNLKDQKKLLKDDEYLKKHIRMEIQITSKESE